MQRMQTNRGFMLNEFTDRNGIKCSIQQSSAIGDEEDAMERPGSSVLWLGVDDAQPVIMAVDAQKVGIETHKNYGWIPYPIPKEVLLHTRMHLSRQQVISLINSLQHWVDTGELP